MDNLERYNNVFKAEFNVLDEKLTNDFMVGSIKQWDSIKHLSLVTAIEDEFDIMLDSEDILDFKSYENGRKILAKYDVIV
ncbi:MAG: acyl carrier protein [Bacteroidota bacterium]